MARTTARQRGRERGQIEELPSGSLRVTVYAGIDPLTKRRHYLREVIPAGPTAATEAKKALRRLVVQVDEKRNPQTSATVEQLLERHFELLEVEPTTLATYRNLTARHILPLIGKQKVGALRAAVDGGTVEQAEVAAARVWLADFLAGTESLLMVGTNSAAARVPGSCAASSSRSAASPSTASSWACPSGKVSPPGWAT